MLDSLYTAAVIYSESSNIGLVVLKKIYWQMTKPILLDSLYTAATARQNLNQYRISSTLLANKQYVASETAIHNLKTNIE